MRSWLVLAALLTRAVHAKTRSRVASDHYKVKMMNEHERVIETWQTPRLFLEDPR